VEFVAVALDKNALALVLFRDGKPTETVRVSCGGQGESGGILGRDERLAQFAGFPFVAHDAPRLRAALAEAFDRLPEARWVDMLVLSRAVWPGEADHTLPALIHRLGLPVPAAEDAAAQAEATGRVFLAALAAVGALPPGAQAVIQGLLPDPGWLVPRKPPPPRPAKARSPPPGVDEAFARLEAQSRLHRRPQQRAYAQAVRAALEQGGVWLLEAGPGTGKTFGYLVPLLLALAGGRERAVVATRTRALQEQLWQRDLPFLIAELGVNVPCALLKGRENYLCPRRLEDARRRLLPPEILVPLLAWAERTASGDLDELTALRSVPGGPSLLAELRDIPYRCGGAACPWWGRCPSWAARDRARAARLVVVNHALLGADLAGKGKLLGPYRFLVVDEAHGFPGAMREALSLSLTPTVIPRLLGELRRGPAGLLAGWGELAGVEAAIRGWERAVATHRAFWKAASATFEREIGRYEPDNVRPLSPAGTALAQAVAELAEALADLARDLPEEEAEQAAAMAAEAGRLAGLVRFLLAPDGEGFVFWYARGPTGLVLTASPVEVGETLAEQLWTEIQAGVLTSATLAVGDDATAIARELGLDPDRTPFFSWPSPFSYRRVRAFVLRYLPHPDDPGYPAALAQSLGKALAAAPRKGLVLFTSRRLLVATAEHLPEVPILVQGRDGERDQLVARFRRHPPPVLLFGLDTLWEGIDLPGEELELLVIVRLPFPVPTDPVAEAEAERIQARGGSPFHELFLPRAVLKLRQGVGRLVRTPLDRGAVVLADPRIATQSYGGHFLAALPVPATMVDGPDELAVALRDLFR
jgi:ATP-dependent DNA helicase DinG